MWANLMGGGLRGLLDRFPPPAQNQIRDGLSRRLEERALQTIRYDLLFAVATKQAER